MLELSHLDLEFLYFVARFLVDLASAAAVFKPGFAKFLETLDPAIDLLVANIMLDGRFTIVAVILKTFLDDLDALFLGGVP